MARSAASPTLIEPVAEATPVAYAGFVVTISHSCRSVKCLAK